MLSFHTSLQDLAQISHSDGRRQTIDKINRRSSILEGAICLALSVEKNRLRWGVRSAREEGVSTAAYSPAAFVFTTEGARQIAPSSTLDILFILSMVWLFPLGYKLHVGRYFCLFCPLLYFQGLEQYLAHYRDLLHICLMRRWMHVSSALTKMSRVCPLPQPLLSLSWCVYFCIVQLTFSQLCPLLSVNSGTQLRMPPLGEALSCYCTYTLWPFCTAPQHS